ncbi:MAG: DMT family transporter [Alphaproteobacteria bacterium]|nr:DMT family transporter [Alphaproteobacteria bacterium]
MSQASAHPSHGYLLPSAAVAVCGIAWGGFWYPLRWLDAIGVGGAWVSLVFFVVATLSPLPWLLRRSTWQVRTEGQILTGLLLGTAFTLYTVSLVMTDVIHAILLFYLTPVWSTIGGVLLLGERLTLSRGLAMLLGFAGMALILGVDGGLPLPRNAGDWIALISGMLWAAGTLRSFVRPVTSIPVPVFFFSVGGVVSSGAVLVLAGLGGSPLASTGNLLPSLPWIVILALIIFVPPNFLVLWAAQRIDSGRVGILLMTEVLAGAVTAALFSGEAFGLAELAGTTLIVLAAITEVLGRR